jgi:hypothetical protein
MFFLIVFFVDRALLLLSAIFANELAIQRP